MPRAYLGALRVSREHVSRGYTPSLRAKLGAIDRTDAAIRKGSSFRRTPLVDKLGVQLPEVLYRSAQLRQISAIAAVKQRWETAKYGHANGAPMIEQLRSARRVVVRQLPEVGVFNLDESASHPIVLKHHSFAVL